MDHRTHGQNRPFLPALIRRNDPDTVLSTTRKAFRQLHDVKNRTSTTTPSTAHPASASTSKTKKAKSNPLPSHLQDPWTILLTLTGVGPATASLLLSVACPDTIPFFSDEAYALLVHGTDDHNDDNSPSHDDEETKPQPKLKLKYDVKEYAALLSAFDKLQHALTKHDDHDESVSATTIEQACWTYAHLSWLPDERRQEVERELEETKHSKTVASRFRPGQEPISSNDSAADQDPDPDREELKEDEKENGNEGDSLGNDDKAMPKRSKATQGPGKRARQLSTSGVAIPDTVTDTKTGSQQNARQQKKRRK